MVSESDRTCKRCSVSRVNALVQAYGRAQSEEGQAWVQRLRRVEALCKQRGFAGAGRLLQPGLDEKSLRALCWNVSSFLTDEDALNILGVKPQQA